MQPTVWLEMIIGTPLFGPLTRRLVTNYVKKGETCLLIFSTNWMKARPYTGMASET